MMKKFLPTLMLALSACTGVTTPTVIPLTGETVPTVTSTPWDPAIEIELLLVQQASKVLGCTPGSAAAADVFGFVCETTSGHTTLAQLTRFADEAAARMAFDAERGDNPAQCFHGYPAADWTQSSEEGRHRFHIWLASNWLIVADAFDVDDTLTALAPLDVSEAVYTVADVNGFLPAVAAVC